MKARLFLLVLIGVFLYGVLFYLSCGGSDESGGGGAETEGSGDDDDDDDDVSDCEAAISAIYGCGHYFIDADGVTQSAEKAYTECLALFETSNRWICRINCSEGSATCQTLYDCLQLCPSDDQPVSK